MYQRIIPARILTSVGVGLLVFSLVFGWVAFSVPDWLQFYERNGLKNNTLPDENLKDLKKFGLWYKCIFSIDANDFICTLWNNDTPSFVRVAQVLIPFGLTLGCLSLLSACIGFICRRGFVTILVFSALFAFLSFIFVTIGVTVFATESLVYVDRLRLSNNDNARRWGMWLLIPNLIFSFVTSICFIVASILYWCDYRSMQVTGVFSHSGYKYNDSVSKAPSDSNTAAAAAMKKQFQYQDYPNACYQINGLNNNPSNLMGYPPPPSYTGAVNPAFQLTAPGLFGYPRPASPTINPMYSNSNFDSYHPRHYMTENTEMDEVSRASHSRHRSRSRSCRHSSYRSRSYSPRESPTSDDNNNNQKQTQFIPIAVPYYQPQQATSSQLKPMQTSTVASNNNPTPISYMMPQVQQQYRDENIQSTMKPTNMLKYGTGQPSGYVSNPNQPVYTIAYRANNGGNVLASNILTGPAATTYVTAVRSQTNDLSSFNSDSDDEEKHSQAVLQRNNLKKINIAETWAWRKMR